MIEFLDPNPKMIKRWPPLSPRHATQDQQSSPTRTHTLNLKLQVPAPRHEDTLRHTRPKPGTLLIRGWCAQMRAGIFPACPQLRVPRCRERLAVKGREAIFRDRAPAYEHSAPQARSRKDAEGALYSETRHRTLHATPPLPTPQNRALPGYGSTGAVCVAP